MLAISNVGVGYCCIPFARVTFVDILFVGSQPAIGCNFCILLVLSIFIPLKGFFAPKLV